MSHPTARPRPPPPRSPRCSPGPLTEILHTLHPATAGHDWSPVRDRDGNRRDSLFPLAGDEVVTDDGRVGFAMHTAPGRPVLPPGGAHRYVITADNEIDRALPVLAYHVSRLRPWAVAAEVQ